MRRPHRHARISLSLLLLALAGGGALARDHQPRGEIHGDAQGAVRRELHRGEVHSLRDIEGRVLPMMPGAQYLGPEYDEAAMAYRLKFLRDGRVSFIDVDARSGAVIGRSR